MRLDRYLRDPKKNKPMYRLVVPFAAAVLSITASAQELPQLSPSSTVEQIVGLTHIKITYSRPAARGRVIFGDLVPYGELWRTGANQCTTFECDRPVVIYRDTLLPGKYSLFTYPGQDTWGVIFNKDAELWGTENFKEGQIVLRAKAEVAECKSRESFTISFEAVKDDQAVLEFMWENTCARLPISADCTPYALKNVMVAVNDPKSDHKVFNKCARFLLDRKLKLADALTYAQRSVDMEPHWYNEYTLAKAQAANGDNVAAVATAKKSLALTVTEKEDEAAKLIQADIDRWSPKKPVGK